MNAPELINFMKWSINVWHIHIQLHFIQFPLKMVLKVLWLPMRVAENYGTNWRMDLQKLSNEGQSICDVLSLVGNDANPYLNLALRELFQCATNNWIFQKGVDCQAIRQQRKVGSWHCCRERDQSRALGLRLVSKNFGKKLTCIAWMMLRKDVPCWTWMWASSRATTRRVVQWEHLMKISCAANMSPVLQ